MFLQLLIGSLVQFKKQPVNRLVLVRETERLGALAEDRQVGVVYE